MEPLEAARTGVWDRAGAIDLEVSVAEQVLTFLASNPTQLELGEAYMHLSEVADAIKGLATRVGNHQEDE